MKKTLKLARSNKDNGSAAEFATQLFHQLEKGTSVPESNCNCKGIKKRKTVSFLRQD